MPRDWREQLGELSRTQKIVHLAMRMDSTDVSRLRGELVKIRRRAYEQELSIQAGRVGCAGSTGRLTTGPALSSLNEMSQEDAESIVNTYNYDLAIAIQAIRSETPSANRNTYASRLREWETNRNSWKLPQIAQYTENTARSRAQADFYKNNGIDGTAVLEPGTAKCPVCQGWINRGEIPLKEAMKAPGNFHPNCPHLWTVNPAQKVKRGECADLWVGE
jgi:hypothetical protein